MSEFPVIDYILNHYHQGIEDENERIIKLLIDADTTNLTAEELNGWYFALNVIKKGSDDRTN